MVGVVLHDYLLVQLLLFCFTSLDLDCILSMHGACPRRAAVLGQRILLLLLLGADETAPSCS